MNVLMFGGFLGSGKTTVIADVIRRLQLRGETTFVIENEVGANTVDGLLLGDAQVQVTNITGGCACCQVTGSLIGALREIKGKYAPDWVIIEMSGVAYLSSMKEKLEQYLDDSFKIVTVTIVDVARWKRLIHACNVIMTNQVNGGEIIVLNKIDLLEEFDDVAAQIVEICGEKPIVPVSLHRPDTRLMQAIDRAFE